MTWLKKKKYNPLLIPKSKYFNSTILSQIKMHNCSLLHYLQNLDTFIFILHNKLTLWKLLSLMQSLFGKGEGIKGKGNTVVLWYPPRCFIKCLLYNNLQFQVTGDKGKRYFLPSRTHSLGETDLRLLLSGYFMHSFILKALFWKVCLFSTIWAGLWLSTMKSAVQLTLIHNWEKV